MTEAKKADASGWSLRVSDDDEDVAYLRLPSHPGGEVRVSRSVRLVDLIGPYQGPDLAFDFDQDGLLIGIEILV